MATYELAKEGASFLNGKVQPAGVPFPEGSNNWAISGARTTTGRPILANDPHRALTAPSLRYLAHLNAPGLDVIGAGEPFAPGISLGHNGTSSFGLTVFAIDQEDLYVYELDPADHKRYRYGDGWEEMKTITEPIAVAGGAQATAELAYTRHGPVIKVDSANHRAYALRAVWLEPGMSPYYGSMRYLRAKSFTEFRDAISHWGAPLLEAIEHPTRYWAGDAVAKRDKLLVDTLKAAYDESVQRLGPDPAAWKWNSLTRTVFGHPATGLLDPETAKKLTVGPLSRGGSWQTVDINVYNTFQGELFKQWAGATVRLAIDVGNWDASRAINAPGQSGDPDDPHYRDLTAKWHNGQYFPLVYSKPAVLANVEKTIVLLPRQ